MPCPARVVPWPLLTSSGSNPSLRMDIPRHRHQPSWWDHGRERWLLRLAAGTDICAGVRRRRSSWRCVWRRPGSVREDHRGVGRATVSSRGDLGSKVYARSFLGEHWLSLVVAGDVWRDPDDCRTTLAYYDSDGDGSRESIVKSVPATFTHTVPVPSAPPCRTRRSYRAHERSAWKCMVGSGTHAGPLARPVDAVRRALINCALEPRTRRESSAPSVGMTSTESMFTRRGPARPTDDHGRLALTWRCGTDVWWWSRRRIGFLLLHHRHRGPAMARSSRW